MSTGTIKKEIICTVCPRGCHIEVEGSGEKATSATGQSCMRVATKAVG